MIDLLIYFVVIVILLAFAYWAQTQPNYAAELPLFVKEIPQISIKGKTTPKAFQAASNPALSPSKQKTISEK